MAITSCLWLTSAMFIAAASEYIVGDEKVTWLEAETWCLEQGYHLASIHSAEENAEILALCTEPKCWTGLHCIDGDNFEWRWSDGTDFDFETWYPGEPNNKENPTNEDCIEMYDNGMWNNHECQVLNYPVCRVVTTDDCPCSNDPVRVCEASICALGDNWLTVSVSRDEAEFEQLSSDSSWHQVTELTVTNITASTVLRFEVDDYDHTGGFLATVKLQCSDGFESTFITDDGNTYFDVVHSLNGQYDMTEFTKFGSGVWSGRVNEDAVQCMDPDAYWMWNGVDTDDVTFDIDLFAEPETADAVLTVISNWDNVLLGECQADCDSHDHCEGELMCAHRDSTDATPIPGCTGLEHFVNSDIEDWDFCYSCPVQSDTDDIELAELDINPSFLLDECQADCDKDEECAGHLQCFQRDNNDATPIPGCSGTFNEAWDYCFDPCKDVDVATANAAIAVSDGEGIAEEVRGTDANATAIWTETLFGAAIGVCAIGAAVLLAVSMAKRKKSAGKKAETEMCDAVHVPELSPTDCVEMDTVEVATGKESGDGVEAARE